MGSDISAGLIFADGMLVHGADLNAAINNSTVLATAISAKSLKSTMSMGDEMLINDNGTLKKVTGQQFVSISAPPTGCIMDFAGSVEPLGWVFCYGQLINRFTYAALFAAIGTVYGAGDGVNTFAVPDCRGRVSAGDDNMGGTAANRLTTAGSGLDGKTLGAAGGVETLTIATANLPSHTHAGVDHLHAGVDHVHTVPNHTHGITVYAGYQTMANGSGARCVQWDGQYGGSTAGSGAFGTSGADRSLTTGPADRSLTTGATGSGTAVPQIQPTIIFNKIIKT